MTDADIADRAPILRHLNDWHTRQHGRMQAAGTATTIKPSPRKWPKASIALEFDANPRLAALIIWETGEAELDLIDLHTDTHIAQHHDVTTTAEVDRLLGEILTWLHPDSHTRPST